MPTKAKGKAAKAAPTELTSERPAPARTLWLLRHAKTVTNPPLGGADFDRVLAPRGRRDATALGRLFVGTGAKLGPALEGVPRPAVALVSPAARTTATAELVLAGMEDPPECRFDEDFYGAEPDELLGVLRSLPDDVPAAMVVGHNPTAQSLSQGLLSPRDKKGLSLAVRQGFPTCALGVYTFPVEHWVDVTAGSASLVTLITPPYA
jgi:phosphohistidine phosphatase